VHFDSRAIGRFAHPYVEVFSLARFEKENIVAIVEFGKLVKLVEFGFCVQFVLATAVG